MSRRLAVARCGRVDYGEAVVWQERLVARRLTGPPDTLLLLEHPPVYTLGRGADARHLGAAASGPIPAVRAHRGGEVTYHGPGQIVGYPVVDLRALRPDVRWYVGMLEQVLIDTLSDLGIAGRRERGLVGVWVGPRKIGSIGIAVRRWIAWHGFALNVAEDLSGFEAITPCGLAGMEMTSVAREGGPSSVSAVAPLVLSRFVTAFGYGGWDELREPPAAGAPA